MQHRCCTLCVSEYILFNSNYIIKVSLFIIWTLWQKRSNFFFCLHFQTSIFTPAYGSVTNVRVSSSMTTQQVLSLLLNKFRVCNFIIFSQDMTLLIWVTLNNSSSQPFINFIHFILCFYRWKIKQMNLRFMSYMNQEVIFCFFAFSLSH